MLEAALSNTPPSKCRLSMDVQLNLARELIQVEKGVLLTGFNLTLAQVVAGANNATTVSIDQSNQIKDRIDNSVQFLKSKLNTSVYGVTTGFGGSAGTRSENTTALQLALLEHQLCGITPSLSSLVQYTQSGRGMENVMPEHVVRGAMIIRINSLTRGHSAVRLSVLNTLIQFISEGITPIVPLRGSISASGDLSPLSYIAGAITGHPDVKVIVRKKSGQVLIMNAPDALESLNIQPVVMGPKEGLGLINGTAVSASMATFVLHDAHFLALLSQSLTAMTVEAMCGHAGSFDPFIHDITRPHPGQIQAAKNIRTMLKGSSFAVHQEVEVLVREDEGVLRQDRYPLRTVAQWVGPIISDLISCHASLEIELNSTTDNPLIDVVGNKVHHGGNFQATAVTNAMEKTRLGLQQLGKLNYAQMTELVNCSMNRGLPSCLASEDPSTSYHTKGLDIAAAAYTSELGFLANPVSTHVQPAEMANQAVNSLALISARKTAESNDVLSMLLATHLYCVVQALDLRYLEHTFAATFDPSILPSLTASFSSFLTNTELISLAAKIKSVIWRRLEQTTSADLVDRWEDAFAFASSNVLDALTTSMCSSAGNPLGAIASWRSSSALSAVILTREVRDNFFRAPVSPTVRSLGRTRALYHFVRETLGVKTRRGDVFMGTREKTIGSSVSVIYEAVKDGRINKVLVEMML